MDVPICEICKKPNNWVEFTVSSNVCVCSDCKERFKSEMLIVCTVCDAMCFIPKTPKNIERLQYFIDAPLDYFILSDVIIPQNGCTHCVSFATSIIGELKNTNEN